MSHHFLSFRHPWPVKNCTLIVLFSPTALPALSPPNYFCCSSFSGVDGGDIIGNHLTSACGSMSNSSLAPEVGIGSVDVRGGGIFPTGVIDRDRIPWKSGWSTAVIGVDAFFIISLDDNFYDMHELEEHRCLQCHHYTAGLMPSISVIFFFLTSSSFFPQLNFLDIHRLSTFGWPPRTWSSSQ